MTKAEKAKNLRYKKAIVSQLNFEEITSQLYDISSVCGQCFGLAVSYLNVQYKYDYLKAAFDILKDQNTSYLQIIKDIETAYDKADAKDWYEYSTEVRAFDKLVGSFDEYSKIWLE